LNIIKTRSQNLKTVDIALLGLGNVGKAFVRLLAEKRQDLRQHYALDARIIGIITRRHGACIDPEGLDESRLITMIDQGTYHLEILDKLSFNGDVSDFIRICGADVLVETTPVNPISGQPALGYLMEAAVEGLHLITANKGPVVFGFNELTELTRQHGRLFRFEAAVMDGAPIFSLFRSSLAGAKLLGFYGILNSCTNLLLDRMRAGETLDEAIDYGAAIGITESDPSNDVDGWDAAIKVAALSNVLMGQKLTPTDINPTGIRGITPEMIRNAEQQGKRWKLVCQGGWREGVFVARVAPEIVGYDSPLYTVSGTSSYVSFELDVLPALGILETDPSPKTTAFGLLADLIDIHKEGQK
jgi:homoserine dehydrogenase